jgi:hypothetical protein
MLLLQDIPDRRTPCRCLFDQPRHVLSDRLRHRSLHSLAPRGTDTHLGLTHADFPNAELRDEHEAIWPH